MSTSFERTHADGTPSCAAPLALCPHRCGSSIPTSLTSHARLLCLSLLIKQAPSFLDVTPEAAARFIEFVHWEFARCKLRGMAVAFSEVVTQCAAALSETTFCRKPLVGGFLFLIIPPQLTTMRKFTVIFLLAPISKLPELRPGIYPLVTHGKTLDYRIDRRLIACFLFQLWRMNSCGIGSFDTSMGLTCASCGCCRRRCYVVDAHARATAHLTVRAQRQAHRSVTCGIGSFETSMGLTCVFCLATAHLTATL